MNTVAYSIGAFMASLLFGFMAMASPRESPSLLLVATVIAVIAVVLLFIGLEEVKRGR
jgi:hypothetical protein